MNRRIQFLLALAWVSLLPLSPRLHGAPAPAVRAPSAPAVVHVVEDSRATKAFEADEAVVRQMVEEGLRALTSKPDSGAAWRALLKTNDVVGIRVCSGPGPVSGTRPAVVAALVRSLLAAGHPPRRIVLWDKRASDLLLGGYAAVADGLGIRWAATEEIGWDDAKSYDSPVAGRLMVGDHEYGRKPSKDVGRRSFVSKLLTQDVTKIIVVAPLLSHGHLGVNGQLANLSIGAVDNTFRFMNDVEMLATAIPEICALDDIAQRLVFCVNDALVCQFRGEENTLLHYAVPLNQLRFGFDPVALDVLALDEIRKARAAHPIEGEKEFKTDLYLNAEVQDLGVANPARIQMRRR
ncbi:MAG: DUF362 domain-containing protein [Verrucomicrobia bacterium]|nr:MAG: DUF362 domain-containing protein [Verrucomicrobiota bacterium]